jgi:hypothetical protein
MPPVHIKYNTKVVLPVPSNATILHQINKTMRKQLYALFLVSLFAHFSLAQSITPQTINISGGAINTGYYQLEWSVGEMAAIETLQQPGIIITNGVLQPMTDKPFGQNTASNWSNDEIKIFPVPTKGQFEVDILSKQQGQLLVQLVDGLGQIINSQELAYYGFGKIIRYDISRNAATNYYLRITLSPFPGFAKKAGGFKILKIN